VEVWWPQESGWPGGIHDIRIQEHLRRTWPTLWKPWTFCGASGPRGGGRGYRGGKSQVETTTMPVMPNMSSHRLQFQFQLLVPRIWSNYVCRRSCFVFGIHGVYPQIQWLYWSGIHWPCQRIAKIFGAPMSGSASPARVHAWHEYQSGWWFQTCLFSIIYGIILPID